MTLTGMSQLGGGGRGGYFTSMGWWNSILHYLAYSNFRDLLQ